MADYSSSRSAGHEGEDVDTKEGRPQQPQRPCFVMRWLTTLTILGCAVGVGGGALCRAFEAPASAVKLIELPGELFIRALKGVVVPMVFASMVSNAAALGEPGAGGRMAPMTLKFYLSTTFIAAMEGVALYNMFFLGGATVSAVDSQATGSATSTAPGADKQSMLDTFLGFSRDLVPDNIFKALAEMQLLSVITFAIFFGVMLSKVPGGRPVVQGFTVCFDALVAMIRKVILFTPLGVASLVARSVAQSNDLGLVLSYLGKLFGVVSLGFLVHVFAFYGGVYALFTRKNPFRFFARMVSMWSVAFGTGSSAATLGTTCKTCEDFGIPKRTVAFVCTIGCTINMDGNALRQPIAVCWIAYATGQPLPFFKQVVVALVSSLMSIGGSPIPSSGVSTLLLIIQASGVSLTPAVQMLVGFCLAIEWLLDSMCAAVNVTGDAIGAAIINHLMSSKGEGAPGPATEEMEVSTEDVSSENNPESMEIAARSGQPHDREDEMVMIEV